MLPNTRYAKFDVPKDCKLRQYFEQLMSIIRNTEYEKDFVNFRNQLFHDCFAFVKSELKTDAQPIIYVDFVPTQAEYEQLEKQHGKNIPQIEKSTVPTFGFSITNKLSNTIYVNYQRHLQLAEKGLTTFILSLVTTLIHEILHCFFHNLKNEQEIYNLRCKIIETFLGIILPTEIKEAKASDFYTTDT